MTLGTRINDNVFTMNKEIYMVSILYSIYMNFYQATANPQDPKKYQRGSQIFGHEFINGTLSITNNTAGNPLIYNLSQYTLNTICTVKGDPWISKDFYDKITKQEKNSYFKEMFEFIRCCGRKIKWVK